MKLDDIKKLQQKKYRAEFGHFLVEGEHLLLELHKAAAHNPALLASQLYVTATYQHWESPFKTQLISERQMAQIANTHTPQGILAVVPMAALTTTAATTHTRAVYLHEIQDPGNLGTILRTLAWFGGFRCLLSPGSVDPYKPPRWFAPAWGPFFMFPGAGGKLGVSGQSIPTHCLPGHARRAGAVASLCPLRLLSVRQRARRSLREQLTSSTPAPSPSLVVARSNHSIWRQR